MQTSHPMGRQDLLLKGCMWTGHSSNRLISSSWKCALFSPAVKGVE